MSGVRGDLGALRRLQAKLLRLPGMSDRVALEAAAPISAVAQADFADQRTPDGAAWPGRARKHGLVRSGALRSSIGYAPAGRSKLRTRPFPNYARYQNPRLWIPRKSLPSHYRAAIDGAFRRTIRALLEGGA